MKAILVIDEMPKNCDECPIRFSGEPNEWCWYLRHGLDDITSKPSCCPLKPMPLKRRTEVVWRDANGRELITHEYTEKDKVWNEIVDYLEGEEYGN